MTASTSLSRGMRLGVPQRFNRLSSAQLSSSTRLSTPQMRFRSSSWNTTTSPSALKRTSSSTP